MTLEEEYVGDLLCNDADFYEEMPSDNDYETGGFPDAFDWNVNKSAQSVSVRIHCPSARRRYPRQNTCENAVESGIPLTSSKKPPECHRSRFGKL